MRIGVTGSGGFIGSQFMDLLREQDYVYKDIVEQVIREQVRHHG